MDKNMKNKYWEFKNMANESADLYIYGEISSWVWEDETSASSFKRDLDTLGDIKTLNIYINSCGGDVFEGISIGNMIKRHKATSVCHVDGLAASIASVITASCDKVIMYSNSMQMIHNALCMTYGNANDFRKMADDLDKVTSSLRQTYLDRAKDKLSDDKLIELMDAETWLNAQECYDLGLCDEIVTSKGMVAKLDSKFANKFINVPKNLIIEDKEGDKVEEPIIKDEESIVEEPVVEKEQTIEEIKEIEEVVEDTVDETIEDAKKKKKCESEEEIEDLKNKITELENIKTDLQAKLNESNEKVIALNEKVESLQPIVDKYNEEQSKIKDEENKRILDEKKAYYKNKFENLGARSKFESEEVQSLISNCIEDKEALSKLNLMLVDMITISESQPKKTFEDVSKIENLIPVSEGAEKYGFK